MPFLLVENEIITAWYSEEPNSDFLTNGTYLVEIDEEINYTNLLGKNINKIDDPSQNDDKTLNNQDRKRNLRYQLKELYLEREFAEAIGEDTSKIVDEFSILLDKYNKTED